ncbi:MAG: hypothetical protein R3B72_28195 [Polyangiaceae bacterium]
MTPPTPQAEREAAELEQAAVDEERADANHMLGMGASIGAIGLLTATAFGAVCPACIVATPALLGYGLYKRIRVHRRTQATSVPDPETT